MTLSITTIIITQMAKKRLLVLHLFNTKLHLLLPCWVTLCCFNNTVWLNTKLNVFICIIFFVAFFRMKVIESSIFYQKCWSVLIELMSIGLLKTFICKQSLLTYPFFTPSASTSASLNIPGYLQTRADSASLLKTLFLLPNFNSLH